MLVACKFHIDRSNRYPNKENKEIGSMKQFNCRVGLVCHALPDLQASTGPVDNMKRKPVLACFPYKKRTQKQQKKNTTKRSSADRHWNKQSKRASPSVIRSTALGEL